MKSYLSLIPISAKVHKRQNRMTLLCIIFAVFLVTTIFSTAEMGVRMEQARLLKKHGSFTMKEVWSSEMGQSIFLSAIVLFLFILLAGVLMISSSMHSMVAKRTQFFGMMRCIGMSKQQIVHFVRLEALSWCKTAVPIGVILGVIATWGLCIGLRFFVGEEFLNIPIFGISLIGMISGIFVGVITVLIAAGTPAKQASKVSPIMAVSGNLENKKTTVYGTKSHFLKIETALGIHHALSAKKNLVLMMGSFAFSILLFLSFSVLIDFVGYLMPQLSNESDISIASESRSNLIDSEWVDTIQEMEGVKRVFGRRSYFDVLAQEEKENRTSYKIDIISYDQFDLDCLQRDHLLKKGSDLSKVYGNSNYVLATWDKNSSLEIGDRIQIGTEEVEIAGLLKYDPFSDNGMTNGKRTIITSGETFIRLTGEDGYSLLLIQTIKNVTDENVEAIHRMIDKEWVFTDKREQQTSGTYGAFVCCIYGFLFVIACVTILNIVNSTSMSISSRMKQYGVMQAVGMNKIQLIKMMAAEAFTYAILGSFIGCIVGLFVHRMLSKILIEEHFLYAVWNVPFFALFIIVLFVLLAVFLAVVSAVKQMHNVPITEMIKEW